MDEQDQKLSSRIDVLEFAVRTNSAAIRKSSADIQDLVAVVRQNSADIQDLVAVVRQNSTGILKNSADIQALGDRLDSKADVSEVSTLAERVQALENPV